MPRVCLVGLGLIGGSLGMALRARGSVVSGWGRNPKTLAQAKRRGAVDSTSTNLAKAVSGANIVVLCTPVQTLSKMAKKIVPVLEPGTILTDVGSVKKSVLAEITPHIKKRKDISFVGAHPIAGSEKSGVQHASRTLFKNSTCVITKEGAPRASLLKVRSMWTRVGARCVVTTAQAHDEYLALTSHVPHVLSFALFQLIASKAKSSPLVRRMLGGSFRDMTRIAGADPHIWAGIINANRSAINASARQINPVMMKILSHKGPRIQSELKRISSKKRSWLKQ